MREISALAITEMVCSLYKQAACVLPPDAVAALGVALAREESPLGREVLSQIVENAQIAARVNAPICQDTGMAVVFMDIGQDVHIAGGNLVEAVDEGVRRAVSEGGLRASVLSPLGRENTGDNTPAVLHTQIVPGEEIHITVAPKGFGSENMSRLFMLNPSDGERGVVDSIVRAVADAGGNPCPPVVVGVGVGGTAETAMLTAKKSLLRPVGQPSSDERLARLERESLTCVNSLGIGPMGLGGRVTALAVHIGQAYTHIAALPVAVNMQCHCARHAEGVL